MLGRNVNGFYLVGFSLLLPPNSNTGVIDLDFAILEMFVV